MERYRYENGVIRYYPNGVPVEVVAETSKKKTKSKSKK